MSKQSVNNTETTRGTGPTPVDTARHGWIRRLLTVLFYLAWTAELTVVIIDKSALINPWESYIFRGTFAVFTVCVLAGLSRMNRRERLWLLLLCLLGFVCWRISGRSELLRAVVFTAACRGQNMRKAMQYTLLFTTAGCLLLVVLSLAGVLGTVAITQDYGHGVETRYTLGLGHPNALHCMAMMLILLALYLYRDTLKAWICAVLFIFNTLLFLLTKSNTGFLVCTMGILLSLVFHYSRRCREGNALYLLSELGLAAGLVISAVGAVLNPRKYPLIERVDRLLTGRIASLWETTFHEGTLSTWRWFGSRDNQAYFDLGYVRLVYWYGVIPAVILLVLLFWLLRQLRKRHAAAAFALLVTCAVYTVPEAHLVSVYLGRNYCLLLLGSLLPVLLTEKSGEASN